VARILIRWRLTLAEWQSLSEADKRFYIGADYRLQALLQGIDNISRSKKTGALSAETRNLLAQLHYYM
jgi:hypothetical protein